jgi:hypothetical protein
MEIYPKMINFTVPTLKLLEPYPKMINFTVPTISLKLPPPAKVGIRVLRRPEGGFSAPVLTKNQDQNRLAAPIEPLTGPL